MSLERGLSPNTCKAYAGDVGAFLAFLAKAGKGPLDAARQDVSDYLWVQKEAGLKPASLFRKIEAVKSFYAFQAAERRIAENPADGLGRLRLPRRLPRHLDEDEMFGLLRAALGSDWKSARLAAMLELLYATGARVSELLALKPEDVNMQDGWIRVLGKGSRERMVPVHARALDALKRYLSFREKKFPAGAPPRLFLGQGGKPLSRVQFWRELKDLGRREGLSAKLHPHLVRHTFATHLLRGGADLRVVQELLGHASLSTTQIYTHLDPAGLKAAHQKHHPRG